MPPTARRHAVRGAPSARTGVEALGWFVDDLVVAEAQRQVPGGGWPPVTSPVPLEVVDPRVPRTTVALEHDLPASMIPSTRCDRLAVRERCLPLDRRDGGDPNTRRMAASRPTRCRCCTSAELGSALAGAVERSRPPRGASRRYRSRTSPSTAGRRRACGRAPASAGARRRPGRGRRRPAPGRRRDAVDDVVVTSMPRWAMASRPGVSAGRDRDLGSTTRGSRRARVEHRPAQRWEATADRLGEHRGHHRPVPGRRRRRAAVHGRVEVHPGTGPESSIDQAPRGPGSKACCRLHAPCCCRASRATSAST